MTDIVLIQGDSLPLPRGPVAYEDSWSAKLRDHLPASHVVNRSESEKTTDDMTVDHPIFAPRELELYSPSTVIVQMGIVDCAPRYLSRAEKEFIISIPVSIVSRGVNHVLTQLRSRSRSRAYVPEDRFRANLRGFLGRATEVGVEDVVLIKILTAGEKYTAKNPTVGDAITDYNAAIDDINAAYDFVTAVRPLADTVDAERATVDECTIEDGYHLNNDGHERLFSRLTDVM